MSVRSIIVRYKQYYTRGSSWFSYISQFGIITANAKLFEEFFKTWFGWDVMQTIFIGMAIFIVGVVVIGLLDFKYGVWKQENDFGWDATPKAAQLCASVANIERQLCKKGE
jgi:hypothetical protein